MNMESKTPEDQREHLRQEELKKNPTGTLNDSMNRGDGGNLPDLVGGLGWKGTGIGILVLIVGYVVYKLVF